MSSRVGGQQFLFLRENINLERCQQKQEGAYFLISVSLRSGISLIPVLCTANNALLLFFRRQNFGAGTVCAAVGLNLDGRPPARPPLALCWRLRVRVQLINFAFDMVGVIALLRLSSKYHRVYCIPNIDGYLQVCPRMLHRYDIHCP